MVFAKLNVSTSEQSKDGKTVHGAFLNPLARATEYVTHERIIADQKGDNYNNPTEIAAKHRVDRFNHLYGSIHFR
jgi:hypothetical protein